MNKVYTAIICSLVLFNQNLFACPGCINASSEGARVAFIFTTGLLTSLPLILIFSFIFWYRKQLKKIEDQEGPA